jgi:hypothetical protein
VYTPGSVPLGMVRVAVYSPSPLAVVLPSDTELCAWGLIAAARPASPGPAARLRFAPSADDERFKVKVTVAPGWAPSPDTVKLSPGDRVDSDTVSCSVSGG